MDRHKVLFKDHIFRSPRERSRVNRVLQEAKRNEQRKDRFQKSRNISPSPVGGKKDDKENANKSSQQNPNSSHLVKIAANTKFTNHDMLKKRQDHIRRLKEWREKRMNMRKQELLSKKMPFISTVNCNIQNKTSSSVKDGHQKAKNISSISTSNCDSQNKSSSLVPNGHHKGFRPPVGVDPIIMVENNASAGKVGNWGYILTATSETKLVDENCSNKSSAAREALPKNLQSKPKALRDKKAVAATTQTTKINVTRTSEKDKMTATAPLAHPPSTTGLKINLNINAKTPGDKKAATAAKATTIKFTGEAVPKKLQGNTKASGGKNTRSTEKDKIITTLHSIHPPSRKDLKLDGLKMPPPPSSLKSNGNNTGAIGKIKALAKKRTEHAKQIKNSPLKSSGTRLAKTFKAKKTTTKKANLPAQQINGKTIINLIKNNKPAKDIVVQTPTYFGAVNLITSTKIKDSKHIENLKGISFIGASNKKSHSHSSAKRNILQEAINSTHLKEPGQNTGNITKGDDLKFVSKKYNFVRYSEGAHMSGCNGDGDMQLKENELADSSDAANISAKEEKTPNKFGPEERPPNYLSPFVSVTRGKVSLKKEKEIRNSIYLLKEATGEISSPAYSVEVRRTIEAVRYFRKQLQNEIDRLHQLCDIWEVYKRENIEEINNANAEDMINVTIGQTRLLTSKKFMQFKGLIDRCEACATGIGDVVYDGSEDTKPITSGDLEGFWAMLGIQIENLDKRFDNLNRWKTNEWNDPDEEKLKIKKKLNKVKSAKTTNAAVKAKPSLGLQQMLRKMHAEMRKNKNISDFNEVVIQTSKTKTRHLVNSTKSTPRKSVNNSSSACLSITVKDRKYFSPAATVIALSSPNSNTYKSTQSSPKIIPQLKKFNEAFDNMQSSLDLRKSVLMSEKSRREKLDIKNNKCQNSLDSTIVSNKENSISAGEVATSSKFLYIQTPHKSPLTTAPKSILKTPHNIIFNEKLHVKKINFLINEDGTPFKTANGEDEKQKKDCPQRTLALRNRKVRLRPSSEIVIPRK